MSILKLSPATIEPPASDAAAAGGSALQGGTPEAPFAAVLHDEHARSAVAPRNGDRDRAPADEVRTQADSDPGAEPPADDASADTNSAAMVLAALLGDAPVAVVAAIAAETTAQPALTALPGAASSTPVASPAVTPVTGAATPIPGASATMPAAGDATPAEAGAAAVLGASAAQAASPVEAIAAPARADANPQSVAPDTAPVPDGAPSPSFPDAPQAEAPGPPSLAHLQSSPATAASAASAAAPAADQAAAQPTTPASAPAPQSAPGMPSASAPLDAGTPASRSLPPSRTVGLDRAVETVRLALRAGADRGVAHARISLSPRELGGIEIHLRHTAEGLVARVVAEHGGAAQLLQHAGAELRRTLEAQGLTLLALDIGASGEQGGRAAGEQRGFGEAAGRRDGGSAAADDPVLSQPADGDGSATPGTLALSNGVLVDVLA